MKEDNVVLHKSYAFAVRIVKLSQFLGINKQAYQLADQVRRSGASIGANVGEAAESQSRRDFVARCSIAYKEASETDYWLRLVRDTDYLDVKQAESLLLDCEELRKIFTAILKPAKSEGGNS